MSEEEVNRNVEAVELCRGLMWRFREILVGNMGRTHPLDMTVLTMHVIDQALTALTAAALYSILNG